MDKIKLEIVGLSYSQSQSGAYALILSETGGKRRLPIIIGGFEAQAIALELERIKPGRPLTHDLIKSFADTFHISLKEVIINKFTEGVFHSVLVCIMGKKEFEIDSRTSDAVALALKFNCPIFTTSQILDVAGVLVDEKKNEQSSKTKTPEKETANLYEKYTLPELEEMLAEFVINEEYENASKVRDEINKRKKTGKK